MLLTIAAWSDALNIHMFSSELCQTFAICVFSFISIAHNITLSISQFFSLSLLSFIWRRCHRCRPFVLFLIRFLCIRIYIHFSPDAVLDCVVVVIAFFVHSFNRTQQLFDKWLLVCFICVFGTRPLLLPLMLSSLHLNNALCLLSPSDFIVF